MELFPVPIIFHIQSIRFSVISVSILVMTHKNLVYNERKRLSLHANVSTQNRQLKPTLFYFPNVLNQRVRGTSSA